MNDDASQLRHLPASIRAVASRRTIQIVLLPGVGLADGDILYNLPIKMLSIDLRLPNTALTVTIKDGNVVAVRAREDGR
ncbi:MAG: hypothetical protein Fues2KO_30560 [Fuerstiella sp.]